MADGARRNIELKSSISSVPGAREAALRLGARDAGVLEQTDTYFHCTTGRLKLRETAGRGAELVAYARPDHAEPRASAYHLAPVSEPGPLKAGLAAALGVRVVVVKRRQLLLWHNVRVHLDEVEGLGTFCEFEAVISDPDDEAVSASRIDALVAALALDPRDWIDTSYSNLVESLRSSVAGSSNGAV